MPKIPMVKLPEDLRSEIQPGKVLSFIIKEVTPEMDGDLGSVILDYKSARVGEAKPEVDEELDEMPEEKLRKMPMDKLERKLKAKQKPENEAESY